MPWRLNCWSVDIGKDSVMAADTSAELDERREQPSDRAVRACVIGPHGPHEISPLCSS